MRLGFCALGLLLISVLLEAVPLSRSEDQALKADLPEQAWTVLHEGITSDKPERRVLAVRALSLMRQDRRAIEFAKQGLKDRDRRVRVAAAATLGQLQVRSAIPALKQALNDREISVVLAATQSLFLLRDKSAYEIYYAILMGDRKSSKGLIESQVDRIKDPKQLAEIGIAEGIGFVPFGGMGYEAYRQIRRHDASPVREVAARALAHDPDKISADALVQVALADKSEPVRIAALDALSERDDPACIELLARNLSESNLAVLYRTAAVILHISSSNAKSRKSKP